MARRRLIVCLAGILVTLAALAPGAMAGKPTIERITVDDTFADEFLTEACGVPVTTHVSGHIAVRTFSGGGTGPLEIRTLSLGFTATAGDNVYRFRDVGADHVQVMPDGNMIVLVIGQVPFGFTGVLKIDLATGEVIQEPHHNIEGRVDDACAALTA